MSADPVGGGGGWFLNFIQLHTSDTPDYRLLEVKHPRLELCAHVTFKTAQLAAFVGGCVANPLAYLWKYTSTPAERRTRNTGNICRAFGRYFSNRIFVAGLVAGPLVTASYMLVSKPSSTQLRDRCLRIRYNTKNLFVDRNTLMFGFVGWYASRAPGAVMGVNAALAFSALYLLVMWNRAVRKGSLLEDISRQPDFARYFADLAAEASRRREPIADEVVFGCDALGLSTEPLGDYLGERAADYEDVLARSAEGKPARRLSYDVFR